MGQTILVVGTLTIEVTIDMETDPSKTKNDKSVGADSN
jgi:hypothetical protein